MKICQNDFVVKSLIHHLKSHLSEESLPSLRALSSICCSENPSNVDKVLDYGLLDAFFQIMAPTKFDQTTQCLWGLSNIAADSEDHIQQLIAHKELFQKIKLLADSNEASVRREAMFVFTNIILTSKNQQLIKEIVFDQESKLLDQMFKTICNNNDLPSTIEVLLAFEKVF